MSILSTVYAYFSKAVVIAIRYSAARRQFGPTEGGEELAVIEYQLQQWRLFPLLASMYAFKNLADLFSEVYGNFTLRKMVGEDVPHGVRILYLQI